MAENLILHSAIVFCRGGSRAERHIAAQQLPADCRQAPEGALACARGCLGLGSCVAACPSGAISIGRHGAAVVDPGGCTGCGLCVEVCPKELIHLVPRDSTITPRCSNQDPPPAAKAACQVSCISCRICQRNCPTGAISVVDHRAVIAAALCIACGMCAVKCPRGVIVDADGIFTANDS